MSAVLGPTASPRRNSIPVHYVSGTHYEVGYSVVSTDFNFFIDYFDEKSRVNDAFDDKWVNLRPLTESILICNAIIQHLKAKRFSIFVNFNSKHAIMRGGF